MLNYFIFGTITVFVGFFTGLLVGRRNPKLADAAQAAADKVKK